MHSVLVRAHGAHTHTPTDTLSHTMMYIYCGSVSMKCARAQCTRLAFARVCADPQSTIKYISSLVSVSAAARCQLLIGRDRREGDWHRECVCLSDSLCVRVCASRVALSPHTRTVWLCARARINGCKKTLAAFSIYTHNTSIYLQYRRNARACRCGCVFLLLLCVERPYFSVISGVRRFVSHLVALAIAGPRLARV